MKAVRIFVTWLTSDEVWESCVIHEFDALLNHCSSIRNSMNAGVIHIGFDNIHYLKIAPSEFKIHGIFYVTESAKYCLDKYFQFSKSALLVDQYKVWPVTSGLGYIPDIDQINACLAENSLRNKFNQIENSDSSDEYSHFQQKIEVIPKDSVSSIVKILPSYLLTTPIENLLLSVRQTNVFARESILSIEDLKRYSDFELLSLKHFGKTSFNELINQIKSYCTEYHDLKSIKPNSSNERFVLDFKENLDDREIFVLEKRSGQDGQSLTLRKIGDILKISHERTRQLEQRIFEKLRHNRELNKVIVRLKLLLVNRDLPLPLGSIHILDEYFLENYNYTILKYYLDEYLMITKEKKSLDLYILKIYNEFYLSDVSEDDYDNLIERIASEVENEYSKQAITSSQIENIIIFHTGSVGKSLRSIIWKELESRFEFTLNGESGVLFGKLGMSAKIKTILENSETPLHYTKIYTDNLHLWPKSTDKSVLAAVQRIPGVILFQRGTYGMQKHFQFSQDDCLDLIDQILPILQENPSRQWHVNEVYSLLLADEKNVSSNINLYGIAEILRRSPQIRFLSRFVFSINDQGSVDIPRIQIHQAVESLLIRNCGPLSTKEIKSALQSDRGLGVIFQILLTDNIIKINDRQWGLLHRDVHLTKDQIDRLVLFIENKLHELQSGLHTSEIPSELLSTEFYNIDPVLVFSLCQRFSSTMKTSTSDHIYLTAWGSPRRKTMLEAMRSVFERFNHPLTSKEIHALTIDALGRYFPIDRIYNPLASLGVVYNDAIAKWVQTGLNLDEDE